MSSKKMRGKNGSHERNGFLDLGCEKAGVAASYPSVEYG
jgi:hypothetical protein